MALTRRQFTLGALASTALTTTGLSLGARPALAATYTAYAMTYFTESPSFTGANYGLHVAVSRDGLNWTPLNQNNPVVTPTAGDLGLRDPYIHRKQDGTFVVVATDLYGTNFGRNSQYLHVYDSTDLTSFTGYRRIQMHTYSNVHTWAPTVFWDAGRGQYAIVYSANTSTDLFLVNYTS
ncbi:alpha-L-arabinofuranosidase, partial [Micromonospora sp. PTRAS2]